MIGDHNFYHLHEVYNTQPVMINVRRLSEDLNKGVTRLEDKAYCIGEISPLVSLQFIATLMHLAGFEYLTGRRVLCTCTAVNNFVLNVTTVTGLELIFKGLSYGYSDDGKKCSYDILKACGFAAGTCMRVFSGESFGSMNTLVKA